MKKLLILALLTSTMSANAGFFDELTKAIDTTDAILGTQSTTPTNSTTPIGTSSSMSGQPSLTSVQRNDLYNVLKTADVSGNSSIALQEAMPMLQEFLAKVACADSWEMNNTGKYYTVRAASVKTMFTGAMLGTKYHPRTQCMSVARLGDIHMPALNALELQVMFLSDVSGESTTRSYGLIKQSNGSWLVDTGAQS